MRFLCWVHKGKREMVWYFFSAVKWKPLLFVRKKDDGRRKVSQFSLSLSRLSSFRGLSDICNEGQVGKVKHALVLSFLKSENDSEIFSVKSSHYLSSLRTNKVVWERVICDQIIEYCHIRIIFNIPETDRLDNFGFLLPRKLSLFLELEQLAPS